MLLNRLQDAISEGNTAKIINIAKEIGEQAGKTVIELPCEVGTIVYEVVNCIACPYECNSVQKAKVFDKECIQYSIIYPVAFKLTMLPEVGKIVFLTEQAAKDALKGANDGD